MTALHPEALNAAARAYHAHVGERVLGKVLEKAIEAYLAVAFPAPAASPEEQGRFVGDGGEQFVSVKVERSRPFAKALLHEWSLVDGRERGYLLRAKSISLPATIYDAILPKVRLRLRPGGLDE